MNNFAGTQHPAPIHQRFPLIMRKDGQTKRIHNEVEEVQHEALGWSTTVPKGPALAADPKEMPLTEMPEDRIAAMETKIAALWDAVFNAETDSEDEPLSADPAVEEEAPAPKRGRGRPRKETL